MKVQYVRATKSELLKAKKKKRIVEKAMNLLKKKEVLLQTLAKRYSRRRETILTIIKKILSKLSYSYELTQMEMGDVMLKSMFTARRRRFALEENVKRVLGMSLPTYELRELVPPSPPDYSYASTPLAMDMLYHLTNKYGGQLVSYLVELANITFALQEIEREMKKVRRKVNALEKFILPTVENIIKYITNRLFELERDEKVKLNKIKKEKW